MRHGSTSSESWADLDSLLVALYVTIDDLLGRPARLPGRKPKLSDSELACLAVAQVLLACPSEHRWLRFAMVRLGHLFPYLPQQPGYNKRLRALSPLLSRVLRHLALQTPSWCARGRRPSGRTPWSVGYEPALTELPARHRRQGASCLPT